MFLVTDDLQGQWHHSRTRRQRTGQLTNISPVKSRWARSTKYGWWGVFLLMQKITPNYWGYRHKMWTAKHWSIAEKKQYYSACGWSHSTVSVFFLPALKEGLFSSWVTASTTASMLLPPPRRTVYPARAAKHTPDVDFSDLSFGIWPAPPWTTTTGNMSVT